MKSVTLDRAIIAALLLTDGCVSSRFIIFHNKNREMIELFKEAMKKLFSIKHFTERKEVNGTTRVQVNSKETVEKLKKMFETNNFRKKQLNGEFPEIHMPSFIINGNETVKRKFLQVAFSADGSASLSVRWHKRNRGWEIRRRIELTCKHPTLRKEFLHLIKSLGFSPRESGINITLEKKRDIQKFALEIGFVNGVKIGGDSKFWRGVRKNDLVQVMIRTFEIKKANLQNFKSKNDVLQMLRSLLPGGR